MKGYWFEIMKYDIFVVLKFWWEGKNFLEEREKWKNKMCATSKCMN